MVAASFSSSLEVLPGDVIPAAQLPQHDSKPLKLLGIGLRHVPPDTIKASVAGLVVPDYRKNALSLESVGGRVRTKFSRQSVESHH
jgi:exosome complex component RRP40